MLQFARFGALIAHENLFDPTVNMDDEPTEGHENHGGPSWGFAACPHPDCVLVREPPALPTDPLDRLRTLAIHVAELVARCTIYGPADRLREAATTLEIEAKLYQPAARRVAPSGLQELIAKMETYLAITADGLDVATIRRADLKALLAALAPEGSPTQETP